MVWIPINPHMAELGIEDSREEALTYLRLALARTHRRRPRRRRLIDAGPEMVTWLEANTPVKFQIIKDFPDYHPEHPGAKPGGGRSLECPLYPFADLGDVAGPGDGRSAAVGQHHDERDEPRPRRAERGRARTNWSGGASATNAAPGKG